MLLHYLGKSKHMKLALKWIKNVKAIRDIIDSNLQKNDKILIVFGTNIPDTAWHQMAIQISSSPKICFCIAQGNRSSWDEIRKKNISKFHYSRHVAPNSSDHSPLDSICSAMQQRVYGTLFRNINELKKQLVIVWSIINTDTNEWRMHLPARVYTNGQHFENLLSAVAQLDSWINCQPKC